MMSLNELCNDAVLAFAKLVKLSENDWRQRETVETINRSRDLDDTGLTTFLLLQGYADAVLAEESYSLKEIRADRAGFQKRLAYIDSVHSIIDHPETHALREQFQDSIRALATVHQRKVEKDKLEEVLADPQILGELRYAAFRAAADLDVFYFTHGETDPFPFGFNNQVFEFWNVNSLLRLLQGQGTPGISLCLIRDPEVPEASFFAFSIKNGDRIALVTDRETGPHPDFWRMTRRPERSLERRMYANWFPYYLLDLKTDSKGRPRPVKRDALVPLQAKMIQWGRVTDLKAEEFVWSMLTMKLLSERHHTLEPKALPPVAYTGEMVVNPEALVSANSLVAQRGYPPLALPALTAETVTKETLAPQLERKSTSYNEWLIQRFKNDVPDEVLAPVGETAARLAGDKHRKLLMTGVEVDRWDRAGTIAATNPSALSPTSFGTAERMAADRLWIARKNQATVVNRLALDEMKRESPGVQKWVRERLAAQLPHLVEAAARGELRSTVHRFRGFSDDKFDKDRKVVEKDVEENLIRQQYLWKRVGSGASWHCQFWLGRLDKEKSRWHCALTDKRASVFTVFRPRCPQSIASVLGLFDLDELPIWLRHWYSDEPYIGNSILDRLDPADWAINNPWSNVHTTGHWTFTICLALSKSAWLRERRRLGLPPTYPDYEEER